MIYLWMRLLPLFMGLGGWGQGVGWNGVLRGCSEYQTSGLGIFAKMKSKPKLLQAFEKLCNANTIDIGEGDAELTLTVKRARGLEHGAG